MTPRFKAALTILAALAFGTLAIWLVLGSGGKTPLPGGGAISSSPPLVPVAPGPGPSVPDGTSPAGPDDPGAPGPDVLHRGSDGVIGLRTPSGMDLSDPAQRNAWLLELLGTRPTDWTQIARLVGMVEGTLDEAVRTRLLTELRSGQRIGAKEALAASHDPTLVQDLLGMLDADDLTAGGRSAVLDVLARMPGATASEVVRGIEARLDGTARHDGPYLLAIGRRGGREAGRALVEYLGRMHDPLSAPRIGHLGLDLKSDTEAAAVVAHALDQATSSELQQALLEISAQPGAESLVESVARLDAEGQPETVRRAALGALASIGTGSAMSRLLDAASGPGVFGEAALDCLGGVTSADAKAREELMQALEDVDRNPRPEQARVALLQALGNLQHPPALVPLAKAVNDPNPQVRAVAVSGLGRMGAAAQPYVPKLLETYDAGDESVRHGVILALGGVGGDESVAFLTRLQADTSLSPKLQQAVRVSMVRLGLTPSSD